MPVLAYVDLRPLLFLGGLLVFVSLSLCLCKLTRTRANRGIVALAASLVFTVAFTFFLTGYGPFVGQSESREYMMTWEIKPTPSRGMKEREVVLAFVDFPGHYIGEYSDELANHLQTIMEEEVPVIFDVTLDYGKVRCFRETEIAGLRDWRSEWGYAGGDGSRSPWD